MEPTPVLGKRRSPFSGPGAFLQRLAMFLVSSTLVLFLAGSALATIDAPRPIVAQPISGGNTATVVPDVVIALESTTPIAVSHTLLPALLEIPGVERAELAPLTTGSTVDGSLAVIVGLSDAAPNVVDSISSTVQQVLPDAQVTVGGRSVADRAVLDRLNRGTIVAVVPVLLLVAILLSAGLGLRTGLSAGASIALSTLLGSLVAARMVDKFDGTVATTAIPAALVAILVSSVMTFRLLEWFKHPRGEDAAETIRLSVKHLLPEVALMGGGLMVTTVVLAIIGRSPVAALVVTASAALAAIVTLATLPAMLAAQSPVIDEDDYRLFRMALPDGRDFPLAVLAGFAVFLLSFGLLGLKAPSSELLDESALSNGVSARRALAVDALVDGDPTSAIVAELPGNSTAAQEATWAKTASSIGSVGYVDTVAGRFVDGVLVTTESFVSEPHLALATVVEQPRSTGAQEVARMLASIDGLPDMVVLSGTPVAAAELTDGALRQTWLLVGLLALVGAVAVMVILRDIRVALASLALRLLGTAATVGIYFVIADSPTAFELQVAVLVANVGVGLFEVGLVRHLGNSEQLGLDPGAAVTAALRGEGKAALLGVAVTALCGFGLLASDLAIARQLGISLAAGLAIEMLLGLWLLRPVLLGETMVMAAGRTDLRRAATQTIQTLLPDSMDLTWRRTVAGLLRDEFSFQQDPERAELSTVFVEGTSLFNELEDHNKLLRKTGLRVIGRGPIVRKVAVVEHSEPVCLAITVDHPPRQLVDHDGRMVGQRVSERRDGMIWLVQDSSGRHRIVEAVDLGRSVAAAEPVAAIGSSAVATA